MRKLGQDSIQSIINCASKKFFENPSAPEIVNFSYKGHFVNARIKWSQAMRSWYVANFIVVYTRCSVMYFVGNDYDMKSAKF